MKVGSVSPSQTRDESMISERKMMKVCTKSLPDALILRQWQNLFVPGGGDVQ
uniref:Uncharacterized protein n=1 Tax=Rhizophora mucronata TaxID=61149 RepID=A0A2P2PI98_RHIMU